MAIITILRGSFAHGKEVAEKVAQKLGYECVSREILLEASEEFSIPEIKLLHAVKDAPTFLDRFTHGREKYTAFIQAALLEHLQKDNVVYHGFAAHFFLREVPHILKVRIIAEFDDRVKIVMERDGIPRDKAIKFLKKIDEERRKWGQVLYGIDTTDPGLYDMVLNLRQMTEDDAVEVVCHTVQMKRFQTTPESQMAMNDLALAAKVKAALIDIKPDLKVSCNNGLVSMEGEVPLEQEEEWFQEIEETAKAIPGVEKIRIHLLPIAR